MPGQGSDQRLDHPHQRVFRRGRSRRQPQPRRQIDQGRLEHLQEEILLAREIAIEGGLADAGTARHFVHLHVGISHPREQLGGAVENGRATLRPPGRQGLELAHRPYRVPGSLMEWNSSVPFDR